MTVDMIVEITSYELDHGMVILYAQNCSELNLQRLDRYRDDYMQRELRFVINTKTAVGYRFFYYWLHSQKATKGCQTYGEALRSIIGTVTTIPKQYLELA